MQNKFLDTENGGKKHPTFCLGLDFFIRQASLFTCHLNYVFFIQTFYGHIIFSRTEPFLLAYIFSYIFCKIDDLVIISFYFNKNRLVYLEFINENSRYSAVLSIIQRLQSNCQRVVNQIFNCCQSESKQSSFVKFYRSNIYT